MLSLIHIFPEMLITAISLAVAAVPEGLPAVDVYKRQEVWFPVSVLSRPAAVAGTRPPKDGTAIQHKSFSEKMVFVF